MHARTAVRASQGPSALLDVAGPSPRSSGKLSSNPSAPDSPVPFAPYARGTSTLRFPRLRQRALVRRRARLPTSSTARSAYGQHIPARRSLPPPTPSPSPPAGRRRCRDTCEGMGREKGLLVRGRRVGPGMADGRRQLGHPRQVANRSGSGSYAHQQAVNGEGHSSRPVDLGSFATTTAARCAMHAERDDTVAYAAL